MSWTLEEIDDLNPPGPGQSRSRLAHLRAAGALLPDALCETAEQLERRTEPHVALLFQLPHAIRLEQKWHEVAAHERGVECALKAYDARLCARAGAEPELRRPAEIDETAALGAAVTQIVAIFPVWGKRLLFFERYAACVAQSHPETTVIVPQRESWHQNRPMTVRDFETNFAGRLLRESLHVVRSLLPAVSLITRSELPLPERLYACQAMLLPGRLIGAGAFVPVLDHFLKAGGPPDRREVLGSELKVALRRKYRTLGRFEAQLFALDRLRREGETALALIGTVALLEWFFNARLSRSRATFTPSLGHLLKSGALEFLPSNELDRLRTANTLRHKLVHGAPPERYELTSAVPSSSQGRQLTMNELSTTTVREVIDLAFELFRLTNENGPPESSSA